jgi:hypothetical protein
MTAADDGPHAIRANPFEVALWAFAIVLIVGAAWADYSLLADAFRTNSSVACGATGACSYPPDYVIREVAMGFLPTAFAAGLLCLGLAIAVRAIDVNARRRARRAALAVQEPAQHPDAPVRSSAEHAADGHSAYRAAAADDHSLYRRPPA